jgi:pyruvate dehydrogenase E2 component (dihydrolipoamide acetyltransferase)|uniref:Dihydrolipoamide acetyltransferase component of pyruvate dehydrogenase complex n=1 Tax=uncultured Flavobacteriia bacterium TaxID=212695 RepID=F4MLU7_9BACT|nr:dihydrolipoamide acetyltransferase component of pyruvate dehydrogenase complex [uncultured bacterium]CBL87110.1 dihydrolipoamide acetyltransferase [uncultured Flavobacteriia bacterium]|tara:strand:- start:3939 stop:5183 length:1245 start_codon:yes stop_codon:yes gene_type:complete
MAIVINMPRLSDTMTEGVVAKWHVKVGDNITEGSLLAEIETDKATMDFEAFPGQEGILLFRGMDEGASAPVDTILAILGDKDEDISALISDETKPADTSESIEADKESVLNSVIQTQVPTQVIEPVEINLADERIKASPLAKSLAKEKGIDISKITGTGEGGRIIKRDIETHQVMPSVSPVAKKSYPSSGYSDVPISQMRKTIAKRLAESKFTAPHFYLTISVDMDAAIDARKILNLDGDVKISFNDLVVKAVSKALKKHPEVNSSWLGEVIRTNYDINVGVAVAVEDGLLVPVVRNADVKSLEVISNEVKDFVSRAKNKDLQPLDWEGNTFTISNLGMFGIDQFTAIVNPPDSCILAVGGIQSVPVVKDGHVVPGNVMKLTLSCDHRVVDGAKGSAFLNSLKNFLEAPVKMML